jgi:hypothetical protein
MVEAVCLLVIGKAGRCDSDASLPALLGDAAQRIAAQRHGATGQDSVDTPCVSGHRAAFSQCR